MDAYIVLLKEAVGDLYARVPLREIPYLDPKAPVFHQNTSQLCLLRKEKYSLDGKVIDIRRVFAKPRVRVDECCSVSFSSLHFTSRHLTN